MLRLRDSERDAPVNLTGHRHPPQVIVGADHGCGVHKTSVVELVDNALDFSVENGKKPGSTINVLLDHHRQLSQVRDDADGLPDKDAELLISCSQSGRH